MTYIHIINRVMKICILASNGLEGQHSGNYQGVRSSQVRCSSFTYYICNYFIRSKIFCCTIYNIIFIVVDSDLSESSDSPGPRKYSLRQKKPTVDRFQANVEPVRRSIKALRSVLSNSMRRRKHRSKSTSSSDSSDSEPQRYDKKKSKKAR